MGNFYTNYTLRGVTQQAAAAALGGRSCIVTPTVNQTIVVFDKESDKTDRKSISALAAQLAGSLQCPVLAVLNHDDKVLWYQLYAKGKLQDEYDSAPGYFEGKALKSAPSGGSAAKLCAAFQSDNRPVVERILLKPGFGENGYKFAFERHADLVIALGIASFSLGMTYASFENDELPDGLTAQEIVRTGGEPVQNPATRPT